MDGNRDIIFDEESLLLFRKNEKKYSLYSQDSLSSTAVTDSVSIGDDEAYESFNTRENAGDKFCCLGVWESYYAALTKYPLFVKSVTAFVLLGFADVIAQCLEIVRVNSSDGSITGSSSSSTTSLNLYRVARFGFFGLAGAPWTHYYYNWLDTVLPPTRNPWTWTTTIKVIIDQFLQAPALLAFMIVGMALMEGRGMQGIKIDMEHQYKEALIKNWELWIPATVINIAFVKPDLRVLYDNLVFFFWTIFLSMLLNQSP